MMKTKRQITTFTMSIVLFSLVIVIGSFNFMVYSYIKNEAVKEISNEIELYRYTNADYVYDDYELSIDSVKFIQVNTIYLDRDYKEVDGPYLSENEKRIVSYCRKYPLNNMEIQSLSIQKNQYFMAQLNINKDGYLDDYTVFSDDIYDGGTENMGHHEYIVILYTNVTPLYLLAKSMNIVFFALLLAYALLAGYIGIRLGKQIENSQEKLKQFFQNVSHELKTPIMSIQGYAEGIQTNVIKDQVAATQIIIDESQKMSALIDELLYISKIDSGQLTIQKEPIEIKELLYDCLLSVELMAKNKGTEIKIDFSETSLIIYGDEKQLSKAFLNIIVNALRYAESQIIIECKESRKYIEIVIRDDGNGISEIDLPHVFERFYTGEKGNTGIGLSLTKEIIEAHNGQISAGNLDKGAVFKITLRLE